MTPYRLEYSARTDKGLVRETNEDAFGTLPEDGMVVVADGMGGYRAGEVASQIAVDTTLRHLHRSLNGQRTLEPCLLEAERAAEEANLAIWRAADAAPEIKGMGTTVVMGIFLDHELAFAWVGDSRLYHLHDGRLTQLTTDHTLVQELVTQGMFDSIAEAIEAGVGDNVLTRALGAEEPVPVSLDSVEFAPGDLFMFCTDGLNHMVDNDQLEQALSEETQILHEKSARMIELACDAGGSDNITVVLVQVLADGTTEPEVAQGDGTAITGTHRRS